VLTGSAIVDALERIMGGEIVVLAGDFQSSVGGAGTWPGREAGLSPREAEVIALITPGLSNQEIADRAFLSINSIKTYIRSAYRKMGVTKRTEAVIWGIENGFRPDTLRTIDRVRVLSSESGQKWPCSRTRWPFASLASGTRRLSATAGSPTC
jgi:DNA-binding CsgD family transcriptional regulator